LVVKKRLEHHITNVCRDADSGVVTEIIT